MNYKLLIQFDGTDFHGWQVQGKLRTVQGELERVLTRLNGAERVFVHGSGRTDAGVHAENFVASADLTRPFTPERLLKAINGNLAADVRVLRVEIVADDFHARFSARGKTYLYRVINASFISPFWSRFALLETRSLDVQKMNETARLFLGTHDWTAFSAASAEVSHRVRTITDFTVESKWDARANAPMVEFKISGNGFLRYMVRSIVGTILEVGRGEKDSDTIQEAIKNGNRSLAGMTSPAHGLTLLRVHYE